MFKPLSFLLGAGLSGIVGFAAYSNRTDKINALENHLIHKRRKMRQFKKLSREREDKLKAQINDSERHQERMLLNQIDGLKQERRTLFLKLAECNGFSEKAKQARIEQLSNIIAKDIATYSNLGTQLSKDYQKRIAKLIEGRVETIVNNLIVENHGAKDIQKTIHLWTYDSRDYDLVRLYRDYINDERAIKFGFKVEKKLRLTPQKVTLD